MSAWPSHMSESNDDYADFVVGVEMILWLCLFIGLLDTIESARFRHCSPRVSFFIHVIWCISFRYRAV